MKRCCTQCLRSGTTAILVIVSIACLGGCFEASTSSGSLAKEKVMVKWHANTAARPFSR